MGAMASPVTGKVYVHANEKTYQHIELPTLYEPPVTRCFSQRERLAMPWRHRITLSITRRPLPPPDTMECLVPPPPPPPPPPPRSITHTIYEYLKWRMILWHSINLHSLSDWYWMLDIEVENLISYSFKITLASFHRTQTWVCNYCSSLQYYREYT